MTRRRDYSRSLKLPGYWSFTSSVALFLSANKRIFIGLVAIYAVATATLVGLSSQETYSQLSGLLNETSTDVVNGSWGAVGQAGLLVLSGLSGTLSPELTDAQQLIAVSIFLLTWLTTVWLIRALHSGAKPSLRDGLYNAGSPIVPTFIVLLALVVQLLPAALGVLALNAAISTDMFAVGFMSMVISIGVGLLFVLSAYWSVSTFFALIIVTIPGMRPWQALRIAGDIVISRRIRLLLRFIWLAAGNLLVWAAVVLPVVLLDRFISSRIGWFEYVPLVPVVIAVVGAGIVVWSAAYTYLLYRKVVEDDASPA